MSIKPIKNFIINFGVLLASLILVLLICETAIRTKDYFLKGIPFFQTEETFFDDELGWRGKKNFGDTKTAKIKIFVVGDSFTYGYGLPDGGAPYYEILKKDSNAEVFAYGGLGYGTLQEYLVINRYVDEINPDLVVLQVHTNDLINNSWELEQRSFFHNNGLLRPYFRDGEINYIFPEKAGQLKAVFSWSRFAMFVKEKVDIALAKLANRKKWETAEKEIATEGISYKPFREAVDTTGQLVRKIKERIGDVPMIAFVVDDEQPYFDQIKKIFSEKQVEFVDSIPEAIRQKGITTPCFNEDQKHWNGQGHALAGEILSEEVRKRIFGVQNRSK